MSSSRSNEAARRGWAIFRSRTPRPEREEVNAELVAVGGSPISPRMQKHYRRMDRLGLVEYVPINELDVGMKGQ